jgi:hypothetical protein
MKKTKHARVGGRAGSGAVAPLSQDAQSMSALEIFTATL